MRHDNFIPGVTIKSRGRLPHWQLNEATYFITFGLRDSLPVSVAQSLIAERDQLLRGAVNEIDRVRISRTFELRFDSVFDRGAGSCILREHGEIVANALRHFDGSRYDLHAWCVMPNHVHVMMYVAKGDDLPKIVHSWKSYTAHLIGHGVIWRREYFDRIIRSPEEFSETRAYIRNNPAKAGLREWRWVG